MAGPGVVIVGGGLAGQRCAETLRRRGYDEPISIVCAESEQPYDRPPLSKELLSGQTAEAEIRLRPAGWYRDESIELLLGRRATGLDPRERILRLGDGQSLAYSSLLVATGSHARSLPFLERFENVHRLRTLDDARRLRRHLAKGARLAVVGGGFIGQEVAATARRLGCEVTMIEALDLPLVNLLGRRVGGWFADLHAAEGVEVLLAARLAGARGQDRVEQLALEDGRLIACDAVVVGVGAQPNTEWLDGVPLQHGSVQVDAAGRSPIPGIFAAGDAAAPFEPRFGTHMRAEHWDAAARQGTAAAQSMLGEYPGTPPLSSFWSDQYGERIHYVGHAERSDGVFIEGDPAQRDFVAVFTRSGAPIAALAVGRPREMARWRRRIEEHHWPTLKTKARAA